MSPPETCIDGGQTTDSQGMMSDASAILPSISGQDAAAAEFRDADAGVGMQQQRLSGRAFQIDDNSGWFDFSRMLLQSDKLGAFTIYGP